MIFTELSIVYDKNCNTEINTEIICKREIILRSYTLEVLENVRITRTPTVGDI